MTHSPFRVRARVKVRVSRDGLTLLDGMTAFRWLLDSYVTVILQLFNSYLTVI